MRLKRGVKIVGMSPQIFLAAVVAEKVFAKYQKEKLVITSVTDSKHGRGSKHYVGDAIDLRSRNLSDPKAATKELKSDLGSEFDVVLESNHIHVEWEPK